MAELAYGGFLDQQAESGAIEAVRFEREDGRFECLRIIEQGQTSRTVRIIATHGSSCRAERQSPAPVVRR
jgi:hypothetical protein